MAKEVNENNIDYFPIFFQNIYQNYPLLILDNDIEKLIDTFQFILQQVIEQISSSIIITDLQGNIQYVNPAFCNITGYSFEEVLGQNPRMLKSGIIKNVVYENMWETILAGNIWKGELINRRKNGELYSETTIISPIKGNTEIKNFIAIKENAISLKKGQNKKQGKENLVEIGKMTSYILHEIKSPFAAIKMNLDSIKEYIPKNITQYDIIEREVKRLDKLLNETLMYSREKELDIVNVNIYNIVNYSIEMLEQNMAKKKIVAINKVQKIIIEVDGQKIKSLFLYLLENSIDAIGSNGKIEVWSELDNNYIVVFLKDTGCGIESKNKNKIFDPFFTTKYKGSGLGLALVKKILEKHSGSIELLSGEKGNTIFKIKMLIHYGKTKNCYN
jgi:PAS domain S-box-containing protein